MLHGCGMHASAACKDGQGKRGVFLHKPKLGRLLFKCHVPQQLSMAP